MAAVQPRTRPRLNIAIANSRPKPAATTTSNHDNAEDSHAAAGFLAAPPPLSVFLTNLRLLDLDLLPDWPDITISTFSTTGVQGQKRRVQCVEWVLFKLFEIWDPEETRSKLSSLFPPHDQIQSINLRAALLRALDAVKKNGFLGRDSVIRKTMLDDCKGERLEEVLSYFSTAVLKQVTEESMAAAGQHYPIVVKLALENRGYDGDNTELQAMNLAHRASLSRFLEDKDGLRSKYRDFAELLSIKERGLARRMEAIRAKEANDTQDTLSNNAKEEMRRLVRNNWSGNEDWMETLLKGDCHATKESGLLGMPFDRVWRRVQQDRLAEIEDDPRGLLGQLDYRVKLQKERLARWTAFRSSSFGQTAEAPVSPSKRQDPAKIPNRGIDFQFSGHHGLHVGATSQALGTSQWEWKSKDSKSYDQLLSALTNDLTRIKKVDSTAQKFFGQKNSHLGTSEDSLGAGFVDSRGNVSEMSDLKDEPYETVMTDVPVRTNRAKLDSLRRHVVKPQMSVSEIFIQSTSIQSSSSSSPSNEQPVSRQEEFPIHPTDELEELEPVPSPTQDMADDILEAMDHASPSPILHPKPRSALSLAQRTRLSMAGNQSPFLNEDGAELSLRPRFSRNEAGAISPSESGSVKADLEGMDLASRTRLSMAGFEQAQKKAQLKRRESLRRNKALPRKEEIGLAKLDEEGVGEDESRLDHEALTQELIMEEDMEAVFKSRPKMRTSPLGSPAKGW
ncbi:hypothetical protein E4U60_002990 [Claviceps pazoutovae]|uniref:HAUS augmin-like complex subunit 6 N-terminal domain-containing protein n=1 Tax=Claviceps pazoutovae TaxID=1649127 RepID=A0A9P7MAN1_9HYPO|nr:hypothetical protein E4U60_002990 [Claviceps pazoutovae]